MGPVVGMVLVTCPACGDAVEADVAVSSLDINSAYMHVKFNAQSLSHGCSGRRS